MQGMRHQIRALEEYATKRLFGGDQQQAENLADDIQGVSQYAFSPQMVMDTLNRHNVNFGNEQQLSEVIQLIMELANNIRLWENNGHTPNELLEIMGQSDLRLRPERGLFAPSDQPRLHVIPGGAREKIGRNDPCPCGSGHKYKKCCGR